MADGFSGQGHARLKSLGERIERLEEDKKAVTADLGEVFAEAKDEGFEMPTPPLWHEEQTGDALEALAAMSWPPALEAARCAC